MKHPPHPIRKWLENLDARLERRPLVNHHVQPKLGRNLELLLKQRNLPGLERLIISGRPAARARQPVVVDSDLADGHHLWRLGQALEFTAHIVRRGEAVVGVPAHRGEHAVEALGQIDRAAAAFQFRADGDDARDARIGGSLHHLIHLLAEIGEVQVGVCVVKFRHRLAKRWQGHCNASQMVCHFPSKKPLMCYIFGGA